MYKLLLLSQEATLYEGDAISVIAPGSEGYLQILTGHAPLITPLKKGKLTYIDGSSQTHALDIDGGVLEVQKEKTTILLNAEYKKDPPSNDKQPS